MEENYIIQIFKKYNVPDYLKKVKKEGVKLSFYSKRSRYIYIYCIYFWTKHQGFRCQVKI